MLEGVSEAEFRDLLVSIGTHKNDRRLLPVRVAELIDVALRHASPREVAKSLHLKDASLVDRFRMLLRLDPPLQALVGWGNRGPCQVG